MRQARLKRVFNIVSATPQTAALLKKALADNVTIKFSKSLSGTDTMADYNMQDKKIRISFDSSDMEAAESLVHELRHYWQYKTLGLTEKPLFTNKDDPRLAFIFERVVEADAFAFEADFVRITNAVQNKASRGHKKNVRSRQADSIRCLRSVFTDMVRHLHSYDKDSSHVFLDHLKNLKPAPAAKSRCFRPSIARLRRVLKAGIGKNAPGYLDGLSDRQFEALVWCPAHKGGKKVVGLMEKFNAAARRHDKKSANLLRQEIRQTIRKMR